MFLGIMNFRYNAFDLFGFFGYIFISIYFIIVFKCRKCEKNSFVFSIIVFIIYFIFIISKAIENNLGITFVNILWFIPFALCLLVDGTIYLIKRFKDREK